MATLEKIRSKSGLLLVVIGVALLAFIIGDGITSGRTLFGGGTTIAKVGNDKIDFHEFQRRFEEINQQYQQQNIKQDPAMIQQQVLNQMINERLINNELDALGIVVTDNELSKNMLGKDANMYMIQWVNQLGFETPEQLYDMAFNAAKYGVPAEQAMQAQSLWIKQEEQMEQMLKQQKFVNLISGAITANELDAKALYDENASTSHIAYVKKSYSDLKNDDYEVSASEIKAQYNKDKNNYKVDEETRRVSYIAVNIAPSATDIATGKAIADTAASQLRQTLDLNAVSGDSNFGIDRKSTTAEKITNTKYRAFITSAKVGDVMSYPLLDDEFAMVKLLGKKNAVDSVNIDIVMFQGETSARDSVLLALNAGKTLEDVASMPGVINYQADLWQSLASAPDNAVKDRILKAGSQYFIADSAGINANIVRVNNKKAPVDIYDYAVVTHKVYPSDATLDELNSKLGDFIAEFTVADSLTLDKVIRAGYTLQKATVTANSSQLSNIPYSRAAVKWVMDAEKGNISPIIEDGQNEKLIVVALNDIIEPGYASINDTDIRTTLTNKVRNQKKAADLIAQYEGKATDLDGYATAMQTKVDSAAVTFGQMYISGIGVGESTLLGKVVASEENKLVGPIEGNNGIYVYSVYKVDNESRPYSYEESAARYNQLLGSQAVMNNVINILKQDCKVENNTLRFYSE